VPLAKVLRTKSSLFASNKAEKTTAPSPNAYPKALSTGVIVGDGSEKITPYAPSDVAGAQAPTAGPRILDRETGGQFVLGQNFPNPYDGETTIPFALTNGGDVRLDLFDVQGRKMASIARPGMSAGEHIIHLNLSGLGLAAGEYSYQLQVTNGRGVYRQSKMMTAAS
jgi:hypothetical protein